MNLNDTGSDTLSLKYFTANNLSASGDFGRLQDQRIERDEKEYNYRSKDVLNDHKGVDEDGG